MNRDLPPLPPRQNVVRHSIFKDLAWKLQDAKVRQLIQNTREKVLLLLFIDDRDTWTLNDHIATFNAAADRWTTLSGIQCSIQGSGSVLVIFNQDGSSLGTIPIVTSIEEVDWKDLASHNEIPDSEGGLVSLLHIEHPIAPPCMTMKDALLYSLFPEAHIRMHHSSASDLRKLVDSTVASVKSSEESTDARETIAGKMQLLYSKLETILSFHPVMKLQMDRIVKLEHKDSPTETHALILSMVRNSQMTPTDTMLEWTEARICIHAFSHLFVNYKESEWNDEIVVWDMFSHLKTVPDEIGLLATLKEKHTDILETLISSVKEFADMLIADSEKSDKLGLFESRTPYGRALVMFAMYQQITVELSAAAANLEPGLVLNSDTLFPIFVHIISVISQRYPAPVIPLLSSIRFIHRYRRSNALWRGESGWGMTNIAGCLQFVYQTQGKQFTVFEETDSPKELPNLPSRPESAPSSRSSFISRSGSSFALGISSFVKNLASGSSQVSSRVSTPSQPSISFFTRASPSASPERSPADEPEMPLPNLKFKNLESAKDLSPEEVQELLNDYKTLLAYVTAKTKQP